ncbi:MAG: hypothetical protein DRP01_11475 [Archaeoglobales archaeon]|nr:MAG: hypothetical protein DRP01_11475 [Archaeoglobales archaeon]
MVSQEIVKSVKYVLGILLFYLGNLLLECSEEEELRNQLTSISQKNIMSYLKRYLKKRSKRLQGKFLQTSLLSLMMILGLIGDTK